MIWSTCPEGMNEWSFISRSEEEAVCWLWSRVFSVKGDKEMAGYYPVLTPGTHADAREHYSFHKILSCILKIQYKNFNVYRILLSILVEIYAWMIFCRQQGYRFRNGDETCRRMRSGITPKREKT